MNFTKIAGSTLAFLIVACNPGTESPEKPAIPGEAAGAPWAGVGPAETLRFTGTEPFWGGDVGLGTLTWKTPENQTGAKFAVERFAGRNGLGFNGMLAGAPFEMAVSEAPCSDGMSDRTYPFTVTVRHEDQTLRGCGWTDRRSFSGSQRP